MAMAPKGQMGAGRGTQEDAVSLASNACMSFLTLPYLKLLRPLLTIMVHAILDVARRG